MDEILTLLPQFIKSNRPDDFEQFLGACEDLKVFHNKTDNESITLINGLLNEQKSREQGLLLLRCMLPQCLKSELADNVVLWMHQCLRVLAQKHVSYAHLAYNILDILFGYSVQFPDIRKEVSTNIISKFADYASTHSQVSVASLKCLTSCLKYYGRSCGPSKGKFENLLISHIESSPDVIKFASECYHYLAQCGAPSASQEVYIKAWQDQFVYLLNKLHSILDILFENVNEVQTWTKPILSDDYPGSPLPEIKITNPFIKFKRLCTQFKSLAVFLETMLLETLSVEKLVGVEGVMSVVSRCLAVTIPNLKARISTESLSLMTQMTGLYIACFDVLTALIKCCRTNLIFHGATICKLIMQTLKWSNTQEWTFGSEKPYSTVRSAAYECLTFWLTTVHGNSAIHKLTHELLTTIISDVRYTKPTVILTVDPKRMGAGKMSRKKRTALLCKTSESKEEVVINLTANSKVCNSALRVIPALLDSVSGEINAEDYRELQEVVVGLLFEVQREPLSERPIPYTDHECRVGLYRALLALVNFSHPSFPAPITHAITLFNNGLWDPSLQVNEVSSLGLSFLDKLCRPTGPSLSAPMRLEDVQYPGISLDSGVTRNHVKDLLKRSILDKHSTGRGAQSSEEEMENGQVSEGEGSEPGTSSPVRSPPRRFDVPQILISNTDEVADEAQPSNQHSVEDDDIVDLSDSSSSSSDSSVRILEPSNVIDVDAIERDVREEPRSTPPPAKKSKLDSFDLSAQSSESGTQLVAPDVSEPSTSETTQTEPVLQDEQDMLDSFVDSVV